MLDVRSGSTSRLSWAGGTTTGPMRMVNEDAFGCDAERGIFVVADGCGGGSAGTRAADIVVETTIEAPSLDQQEPLAAAFAQASERILREATGANAGMGATAAALRLVGSDRVAVAHVGDCRVGCLDVPFSRRSDDDPHQVAWLTVDHLLWVEALHRGMLLDGVRKLREDHGNVITRALGVGHAVDVDARYTQARRDQLFILASDGLHAQVDDAAVGAVLREVHESRDLAEGCRALLEASERAGGRDNATVVLVAMRP